MKKSIYLALMLGVALPMMAQQISNADFRQLGKDIQIVYDLNKKANVRISLIDSAGVEHPLQRLRGDVGKRIKPGANHTVIWSPLDEPEMDPALLNSDVQFKIKARMPYRTFVMFNGNYAIFDSKQWQYGLTIGGVGHIFGWYITGLSSFTFYKNNGKVENGQTMDYLFQKDKGRQFAIQGTAGVVWRLWCPLELYAGLGYGLREVQQQTHDGKWIVLPDGLTYGGNRGLCYDFGLMIHGSGLGLRLGLSKIQGDKHLTMNFGIGFII